jgi:hypothetical protein
MGGVGYPRLALFAVLAWAGVEVESFAAKTFIQMNKFSVVRSKATFTLYVTVWARKRPFVGVWFLAVVARICLFHVVLLSRPVGGVCAV